MTWVSWVFFAVELLFKYGPGFVAWLRQLVRDIDKKGESEAAPLTGLEKAKVFNAFTKVQWTQKKGVVPTGNMIATAREWAVQRERGRNWKSDYAEETGLVKFYKGDTATV